MSTGFRKDTNIKMIMQSLPSEQIKHMSHVGILVGVMTAIVYNCGIYSNDLTSNNYKFFGDAAFYHDIGKIWIPKKILLKPGRLTDEEFYIMQKHTVFAKKLFQLITDGVISGLPIRLISLAYNSAVYHHEWWNGQGYPYGICRESIPLIARITSICDAYDAITNNRTYRKAHDHSFACHELKVNAGIQFDPILIQIFLDYENTFLRLFKN